jgi:toxin ParE1/3/4
LIELRWTDAAAADLERIADYLFEHSPEHAACVVRAIYDAPAKLREFPGVGRPGKVNDTRELVLTALPYLVVYIHTGDVIHIARILHGAQKWP